MYTFECEFINLESDMNVVRIFEIDLIPYGDQRAVIAWRECAAQALEYAAVSCDCIELSSIKLLSC